jgi:hypothetical protein
MATETQEKRCTVATTNGFLGVPAFKTFAECIDARSDSLVAQSRMQTRNWHGYFGFTFTDGLYMSSITVTCYGYGFSSGTTIAAKITLDGSSVKETIESGVLYDSSLHPAGEAVLANSSLASVISSAEVNSASFGIFIDPSSTAQFSWDEVKVSITMTDGIEPPDPPSGSFLSEPIIRAAANMREL